MERVAKCIRCAKTELIHSSKGYCDECKPIMDISDSIDDREIANKIRFSTGSKHDIQKELEREQLGLERMADEAHDTNAKNRLSQRAKDIEHVVKLLRSI